MVLPLGDSVTDADRADRDVFADRAERRRSTSLQLRRGEEFTTAYAATPFEITRMARTCGGPEVIEVEGPAGEARRAIPHAPIPFPIWVTLLTSMFLHGSPLHLAGNMLYPLDLRRQRRGSPRDVPLPASSTSPAGVMGTIAQIAANPDSHIPTLGASGAIAGMMGAYVIWFPRNRVRVLVFRFITEMPAVLVIGALDRLAGRTRG